MLSLHRGNIGHSHRMFCGFYVFQMFRLHLDEVNGPLEGSNRVNNFVVGATLNLLDVIALPASSHRNYLPHPRLEGRCRSRRDRNCRRSAAAGEPAARTALWLWTKHARIFLRRNRHLGEDLTMKGVYSSRPIMRKVTTDHLARNAIVYPYEGCDHSVVA